MSGWVPCRIVELIKNLGMLCLITHWLACMFGLLTSAHAQVNWAKVYFEDMAAATPSPESDTPLSMASPGTGSDSPSPTPTQTPSSHELSAERWQACGVDLPMTHVDCYTGIQLYLAALYWSTMTVTTIG